MELALGGKTGLYSKCVIYLVLSTNSQGAHSHDTDVLSLICRESEAEWAKDGVNIVNGWETNAAKRSQIWP